MWTMRGFGRFAVPFFSTKEKTYQADGERDSMGNRCMSSLHLFTLTIE